MKKKIFQYIMRTKNGKLDLNYITPNQLKAVEEFMFGDPTIEKVFIYFILKNPDFECFANFLFFFVKSHFV